MSNSRVLASGLMAGLLALAVFSPRGAAAQGATSIERAAPTGVSPPLSASSASDSMIAPESAARRSAPAGFRAVSTESRSLTMRQDESMGVGRNVAMMGVGVAGVITGLIVGGGTGAVLAVGSGVIGLLGLYRFLK